MHIFGIHNMITYNLRINHQNHFWLVRVQYTWLRIARTAHTSVDVVNKKTIKYANMRGASTNEKKFHQTITINLSHMRYAFAYIMSYCSEDYMQIERFSNPFIFRADAHFFFFLRCETSYAVGETVCWGDDAYN